ncbi:ATP-binding protein [Acaryochloris sp. IP29b_bin.137]|uniref:ATP-binding protein n=1 Tax=Acaryochloris sp. IP29b_bin.137 TaxID=2969217 RepID=UPI0026221F59|nr:ATP-binding protein [Acaryochloris sp. IP29b_bin.137]
MISDPPSVNPHQIWRIRQQQASSLLLYQSVWENEVGQAFLAVLQALQPPEPDLCQVLWVYGQFFQTLSATQQSWRHYLVRQVMASDNPFTQQAQRCPLGQLPPELLAAARHDLTVIQHLWQWNGADLVPAVERMGGPSLPSLPSALPTEDSPAMLLLPAYSDWTEALPALAQYHCQAGCGLMAQYRVFSWQAHQLQGHPYPDQVAMDELVGYDDQRDQLIKNTEALLRGYPALNILLYGSRGAGKSAMIKALIPLYGDRGLRLIEVQQSALIELPQIMEQLHSRPQKFIIFVDDLSFEEDEESYKALKVVLEGHVAARPSHVIVYATSNRRHLIREFSKDRPRPQDSDEIHAWDTVQEKLSLSDRFGLTLTFTPATQTTYLEMVFHLAKRANLSLKENELQFRALQWATRHNGRSGRTARQLIDVLQAELALATDMGDLG